MKRLPGVRCTVCAVVVVVVVVARILYEFIRARHTELSHVCVYECKLSTPGVLFT